MKNLLTFALTAMLAAPLCAQEQEANENQPENKQEIETAAKSDVLVWPAFFAVSQWPRTVDVTGLRLTIPFSTSQEGITGLDLGLWGKSVYFEGIQINLLRNNVLDSGAGIQVGIYNSVGSDELLGLQVGLFNEAQGLSGAQVGLVNIAGEARGFQVGVINRAETFYGYQVGLINIIRDAELRFCPLINIGF